MDSVYLRLHASAYDLEANDFLPLVEKTINPLSKHAAWIFADYEWKGEVHYAFYCDGVERLFPKWPFQLEEGDCKVWNDQSRDYDELETNGREWALQWLDAVGPNEIGDAARRSDRQDSSSNATFCGRLCSATEVRDED